MWAAVRRPIRPMPRNATFMLLPLPGSMICQQFARPGRGLLDSDAAGRCGWHCLTVHCRLHERLAYSHQRLGATSSGAARAAIPRVRRRGRRSRPAVRGRLPHRRRDRHDRVPRRPAGQAAARRGSGRHGQDRAGEGGGGRDESELIRLQCYEGLDEARALYEWNYKKQLLRIQAAGGDDDWDAIHDDIFGEEFLLSRPLLTAIRRSEPTVLLIDETDKADVEVEGLLLEVLSDFQVTIPELGTINAARRPTVVLTSNATRELSEALKRRCLYLHLDYPSAEREKAIVLARVPELPGTGRPAGAHRPGAARAGAEEVAVDLRDPRLGADPAGAGPGHPRRGRGDSTLGVVLKHASDQARAISQLKLS